MWSSQPENALTEFIFSSKIFACMVVEERRVILWGRVVEERRVILINDMNIHVFMIIGWLIKPIFLCWCCHRFIYPSSVSFINNLGWLLDVLYIKRFAPLLTTNNNISFISYFSSVQALESPSFVCCLFILSYALTKHYISLAIMEKI